MRYERTYLKNTMKNSQFSDRLNQSLDKEGFPPKNRGRIQLLAEMVGLTHRGASKWVNGESTPPAKKFPLLAQKLNVNETWLRTGEGNMSETKSYHSDTSASLFLLDIPIYATQDLLTEKRQPQQTISCTLPYRGHFFGLHLDTEAMSPRFPKDSLIIFDESYPAKDGDFVLVNVNEVPVPIFRQLLIVGDTRYLNAHNPKFDRLILTDKQAILGKLVQATLSFT